jgi:hypothetical protein
VSTFISPAFIGQNRHEKKFETKQGAATTADLSQQDLHEEVVALTRLNFKAFWRLERLSPIPRRPFRALKYEKRKPEAESIACKPPPQ